mgnify:CR=1 FL=1
MEKSKSVNCIVEILKKGILEFHNEIARCRHYEFDEKNEENEIILFFTLGVGDEVVYVISFKKMRTEADHIPNVKNNEKLILDKNPFKNLEYTDEIYILEKIYDLILKIKFDEIACYEKFGILLRNPLELKGIYNIDVKFITDWKKKNDWKNKKNKSRWIN